MAFETSPGAGGPGGNGHAGSIGDVTDGDPTGEGPLHVTAAADARAYVIRMVGELDLAGAPALTAAVGRASDEPGGGAPLVLDMRDVSFIDSTGVRTLLEAAQSAGGSLTLMAPSAAVTRVLDLTRLRGRFVEIEDLDDPALGAGA